MTSIVDTFDGVRSATEDRGGSVGFVPTMGYLHEGHVSLLEAARRDSEVVVMSLFVNPLQFNETSDLDAYPRDLDRDVTLAARAGVDLVFAPTDSEMYPTPPLTRVNVSGLADAMEGAHRPGHFEGVATVVAKLFAGVRPDTAYFGRKDAQQLAIVRRMAADLSFPVAVVGCPIIRHQSGLAMSSRNSRLSEGDRQPALALSGALMAAADAIDHGERSSGVVERIVTNELEQAKHVAAEYATVASQATMQPVEAIDEPAVVAVAAHVGPVRLIDNIHIDFIEGRVVVDRGIRLDRPSVLFDETEGGL